MAQHVLEYVHRLRERLLEVAAARELEAFSCGKGVPESVRKIRALVAELPGTFLAAPHSYGWRVAPPTSEEVHVQQWWWNKGEDGVPYILQLDRDLGSGVIFDAGEASAGACPTPFDPSDWGGLWAPCLSPDSREQAVVRFSTGMLPLDHMLGGGLVQGEVVLLVGPKGSGRTTLTLQVLAGLEQRCLYVACGEPAVYVDARAKRLGILSPDIHMIHECDLDLIFKHAREVEAQAIAIDTLPGLRCANLAPGSASHITKCLSRLTQFAQTTSTMVWLIGDVRRDGYPAGPLTMTGEIDVVLALSLGMTSNDMALRCLDKNSFGSTNVVGHFEPTSKGFVATGWEIL